MSSLICWFAARWPENQRRHPIWKCNFHWSGISKWIPGAFFRALSSVPCLRKPVWISSRKQCWERIPFVFFWGLPSNAFSLFSPKFRSDWKIVQRTHSNSFFSHAFQANMQSMQLIDRSMVQISRQQLKNRPETAWFFPLMSGAHNFSLPQRANQEFGCRSWWNVGKISGWMLGLIDLSPTYVVREGISRSKVCFLAGFFSPRVSKTCVR